MNPALKRTLRTAAYKSGALPLWHRLRNRQTLTVFMFHRVLPTSHPGWSRAEREYTLSDVNFARVLDFIARHYRCVGLNELRNPAKLPPCAALITFDDGWLDTLEHAGPLLRERQLPAVVFAVPQALEDEAPRWWADALVEALADPALRDGLASRGLPVHDPQAVHAAVALMSAQDRRALGLPAEAPGGRRQMLRVSQLHELQEFGIELGAHGISHAPLARVGPVEQQRELGRSAAWLDEHGVVCRAMAFPHGSGDAALASDARLSGFEFVFSSRAALCHMPSRNLANRLIPRVHLPESRYTCDDAGQIDPARMASFLFMRPLC
jgi:peptidoglycan/xylan/chitin deacetylase (PgdA/CDA1 family)